MNWHRQEQQSLLLELYVQPGAKRTEVCGLHGDALKIRLAAAPVEGKANAALISFIAQTFKVPQRAVELLRGEQSRHKVVKVTGSEVPAESLLA